MTPVQGLSDETLEDIAKGCEGVTQGAWHRHEGNATTSVRTTAGLPIASISWDRTSAAPAHRDASHIARLDPQTVLSLVSELQHRRAYDGGGVVLHRFRPIGAAVWSDWRVGKANLAHDEGWEWENVTFHASPPITPANIEHVEGEVVAWMIPGSGSITTERKTATAWENDFGCTVQPLVRAQSPASGVRVKPLDFRRSFDGMARADSIVGRYEIWTYHEAGEWFWKREGSSSRAVADENVALAECQSDYEARIKSSLVEQGA